jgi:hypothetical protein
LPRQQKRPQRSLPRPPERWGRFFGKQKAHRWSGLYLTGACLFTDSVFGRAWRRQPIIFCALSGQLPVGGRLVQQLSSKRRIRFALCHSLKTHGTLKIFSQQLHRDLVLIFSATQLRSPHLHSNIWNVRPVGGSSMLVVNLGWSPQRVHCVATGWGVIDSSI